MATLISRLPAKPLNSDLVNVVIDTPKGSRNKYKFDEQDGQWRLGKVLPEGAHFPFNFGFIPSTKAEDGDPIDVLLLAEEPAFTGCVIPARLIGVLEAEQTQDKHTIRNDRLIAVIETPYNPPKYHSLNEVESRLLDEVEHFFIAYNQAEGRRFNPLGRRGPDHAHELLKRATVQSRH